MIKKKKVHNCSDESDGFVPVKPKPTAKPKQAKVFAEVIPEKIIKVANANNDKKQVIRRKKTNAIEESEDFESDESSEMDDFSDGPPEKPKKSSLKAQPTKVVRILIIGR